MEVVFICDIFFILLDAMGTFKVDAETVPHDVAESAATHERLSLGSMESLIVFLWRLSVGLTASDHTSFLFSCVVRSCLQT